MPKILSCVTKLCVCICAFIVIVHYHLSHIVVCRFVGRWHGVGAALALRFGGGRGRGEGRPLIAMVACATLVLVLCHACRLARLSAPCTSPCFRGCIGHQDRPIDSPNCGVHVSHAGAQLSAGGPRDGPTRSGCGPARAGSSRPITSSWFRRWPSPSGKEARRTSQFVHNSCHRSPQSSHTRQVGRRCIGTMRLQANHQPSIYQSTPAFFCAKETNFQGMMQPMVQMPTANK